MFMILQVMYSIYIRRSFEVFYCGVMAMNGRKVRDDGRVFANLVDNGV